MRIERLNIDTIKIAITVDDLKEWNIDFSSINNNTKEAQDMFWAAIKMAETEVGFFVDGSHLLVEAVQGPKEGFVMHITKVSGGKGVEFIEQRRRNKIMNLPSYIYQFDEFEDVCCATKCIESMFVGESSLHKYNKSYFLHLSPYEGIPSNEIHNTLSEYARKIPEVVVAQGFLNEYAKAMIESKAVEKIAEHF